MRDATIEGMGFPDDRLRRLRRTPGLRRAFAETSLAPGDLIAPLFVKEGIDEPAGEASDAGIVRAIEALRS